MDNNFKPKKSFSSGKPGGSYSGNKSGNFGEKRSFGDKPSGERKPYGEKKQFGDRPSGERKPYGDRPSGERKPYGDRPSGERKPYGDRPYGEKKQFGDRPFNGERKPYGENKQFGDRPSGERRPYGEKKQFGDRPFNGERKPYGENKQFGDRPSGERRPYGEKKQFGDRPFNGERKPYGENKQFGDRPSGERRPYGEKKQFGDRPSGERKPYGENKQFGDRPFNGDRKPYGEKKQFGDRPFNGERKPYGENKQFGDRPSGERKPYGEKKQFGDRPFNGDRKPYGEKKQFGDRPFGERKPYGEKKPFEKRPFSNDRRFEPKKTFNPADNNNIKINKTIINENVSDNINENSEINSGLVYGRNSVLELLKTDKQIDKIYVQSGQREGSITKIVAEAINKSITVVETDKAKLDKMINGSSHQGVIASTADIKYCSLDDILECAKEKNEKPFILIADKIMDPQNMGALIRTAECAGVHGIIIPKRHSTGISPLVNKISEGAVVYSNIAKVTNIANTIAELKEKGVWIVSTSVADNSENVKNYDEVDYDIPLALVVGNEGEGLSELVMEKSDFLVTIPMNGNIKSLNVSCAGAILMFEIIKKRNIKK